jgi:ABC-type polysaccharide/polyol phosphate export permease
VSAILPREGRVRVVLVELAKLPAFLRRDFLVAWSYRLSFVTDWASMIVQVIVFNFVSVIVKPDAVGEFGGTTPTYMEFVAVGIAISSFMAVGLGRVYSVIRQEQLQGTLESLLLTPTAYTTIQMGSVVYDLIYVPVRTFIFLGLTSLVFGTSFDWSTGLGPTLAILLAFIPFVWGLGVLAAAWTLTFKRGTGVIGIATTLITIGSGTYFPIDVLPTWAQNIFQYSPVTIALDAAREALLGSAGWAETLPEVAILVPWAAVSLAVGVFAFRKALERERRRGTLGLY